MKIFSTFTGIGGFEVGVEAVDPAAEFVGYSEIDKYASSVYEYHFKGVPAYGDITKINADELPDFDCLVGGFPCQAFSIAGKRKGFEDTRGTLFFDLARILRAKQPRLFVFENVKGLLSHDGGRTFKTIIQTIDELGYDCQWQVLNSKNHGVPQNRERVYIAGHLRGTPRPEVFPITGNGGKDTRLSGHISNTLTARYEGAQAVGTYISEGEWDAQKSQIRRLTPIECERLQGFPETEVTAIIEVCTDHQKNSVNVVLKSLKSQRLVGSAARTELLNDVSSAISNSPQNNQPISKPAQPNVHIRLEGERVEIRNQQRSLLYASGATNQSSSVLRMPNDDFAQTIAGILRIAEKITTTGKAASAQNEQSSTAQGNGNSSERTFGYEITLPVNDALSDLTILKESLKYTTSDHLDLEKLGSNLATLSYCVASAMNGYTDDSTKTKSISTFHLSERYGWTQYGTDGAISDTQRYKMCGNAVTTNVVQAVFERILTNG